MITKNYKLGTLGGIAAALIWSMYAPVIAFAEGVNPFLFNGIAHAIGFCIFLIKWTLTKQNPLPELKTVPLWLFIAGLFGIGVHEVTWVAAIQQAPPLEAALIIYTWPLLVVIFTTISLKQKFYWYHILGGLFGMAGIFILFFGRGMLVNNFTLQTGHLWAVISSLTWSIFSALSARQNKFSSNVLSVIFLISSIINFSIWYFIFSVEPAPISSLILLSVAAVFTTSGYILWDFGMKHGNTQLIGVVSFLTPVLAAFYLLALGKAEFTYYLGLALLLVILGIGIAKYGPILKKVGNSEESRY